MGDGEECSVASDCLSIYNDSVIRFCYLEADFGKKESFCDCSSWYGWKGEECNETSLQLYLWRFYYIFIAVWGALLVVFYAVFFCNRYHTRKEFEGRITTYIIASCCFGTTAFLLLLQQVVLLPSAFDPEKFYIINVIGPDGDIEFVVENNFLIGNCALGFAGGLVTVGKFVVSLTWFQIIRDVSRIFPDMWTDVQEFLTSFLKIYTPLTFLGIGVFVLTRLVFYVFFYIIIISTVFFGILVYLGRVFIRKLSDASSLGGSDPRIIQAVALIRFTFGFIITTAVIEYFNIMLSAYTSFVHYGSVTPGDFNFSMLTLILTNALVLADCTFFAWYLRLVTNNLSRRKTSSYHHLSL